MICCMAAVAFSFLPGVSFAGHLGGFVSGALITPLLCIGGEAPQVSVRPRMAHAHLPALCGLANFGHVTGQPDRSAPQEIHPMAVLRYIVAQRYLLGYCPPSEDPLPRF